MIGRFLWICAGGALGTGARHLLSTLAFRLLGTAFPWGTLLVNVAGSFLAGLVTVLAMETSWLSPTVRQAVGVGVLGGFTTYSTFNAETLAYLRSGAGALALLYAGTTLAACLLAGFGGLLAGRAMLPGS